MLKNANKYHGSPCKNCGRTLKYKSNTRCVVCKLASDKKWKANNREKVRANYRRWAENNQERKRATDKKWKANNRKKTRAHYRRWAANNREKTRAHYRKWIANNREKSRAYSRKWAANNPEKIRAQGQKRRAQIASVFLETVREDRVYQRDNWLCQICGEPVDPELKHPNPKSVSLDHIIPLSRGGEHSYANTQCSHLVCNLRKGSKLKGKVFNRFGERWRQLGLFK